MMFQLSLVFKFGFLVGGLARGRALDSIRRDRSSRLELPFPEVKSTQVILVATGFHERKSYMSCTVVRHFTQLMRPMICSEER